MDYRELYRDLNQISMNLNRVELSEVIVVHRMYVSLDELEGLVAARVKRVYVFADVVEHRGAIRMPGSVTFIILCRLLRYTWGGWRLFHLPFMRLHLSVTATSQSITAADGMKWGVYIYAEEAQTLVAQTISAVSARDSIVTSAPQNVSNQPCTVVYSIALYKDPNVPFAAHLHWEPNNVQPGSSRFPLSLDFPSAIQVLPRQSHVSFTSIPEDVVTDPNILLGMQTTVLIAELVKECHPSPDIVDEHLIWLNKVLVQFVQNESQLQGTESYNECLALLCRVQSAMKLKRIGLVVPQLQYRMYGSLINQMAQVARSYDQDFKQLKFFILQNEILGSYLLQQNKAFAEKELQMEGFHSAVISQRKGELDSAITKMERLSLQMEEENRAMEQAKKEMDEGLRKYQNEQAARAVFAVLGAVAMIGLAFVTGGATAPAAVASAGQAVNIAGQAAQGLKRVVEILEQLQAIMEVVAAVKDIVDSLQQVGQMVNAPEMPDMPSEADWSIFVNEIEAAAEGMPTEVSEVLAWKAKCKNVAALGREMTITGAQISQLQYEIWLHGMMREIAQSHADRLAGIQPADLTNYLEMVTQMDMRTTRMVSGLLYMLQMQNAALMYEYLLTPIELTTWPVGMDIVGNLLIEQESAALLGLAQLGPSTDLTVRHVVKGIPVSLLLDGEDWEFEIPVQGGVSSFPMTLSRVRIRHLEMHFVKEASDGDVIIHQPATQTGKVYILLQGSSVFHDRKRDEVMTFQAAVPLNYHFAYRLDTGETTLSNVPSVEFANKFMRMTPYTRWRLRLSASAKENAGLAFPTATALDSTTQIVVTFHVTAIRQIDWKKQDELQ